MTHFHSKRHWHTQSTPASGFPGQLARRGGLPAEMEDLADFVGERGGLPAEVTALADLLGVMEWPSGR